MSLSKSEEQLMQHIWTLKKAFLKDIHLQYNSPRPALTTLATLLNRMTKKKYISYEQKGKSREYFALIEKNKYFAHKLNGIIKNFFDGSTSNFASFFTKESELTDQELMELKKIIDEKIEEKK